ncbi:hypothetical protein DFA_05490 [Cavenderia fasciculata]|uniref:Uncharacterized protein n=1 Tax=Cavenderia fasciculata TaxID=261658 RepID=F4PLD6_CACFS|nr:uncharacterized protein DFA_05490 [Cavenderia fasciculata]EGG23358.1 hypothetical protein DFA_05490 [Cavenderia fasciculata]|eukprot:XP_004361209.1 hypothetical protein DFA_05490 [Cavenderia fasciculata]
MNKQGRFGSLQPESDDDIIEPEKPSSQSAHTTPNQSPPYQHSTKNTSSSSPRDPSTTSNQHTSSLTDSHTLGNSTSTTSTTSTTTTTSNQVSNESSSIKPPEIPFLRPNANRQYSFLDKKEAFHVSTGCKEIVDMLNTMDPKFRSSYRIELVLQEDGMWDLRLCLDPDAWFEISYQQDQVKALANAQNYINLAREEYNKVAPEDRQDPPRCEKKACDFEGNEGGCYFKNKKRDPKFPGLPPAEKQRIIVHLKTYYHQEWVCLREVRDTKTQNMHHCGVKVYSGAILNRKEKVLRDFVPNFSVLSRWSEKAREIMMMPNPSKENNPIPHNNVEMVKDPEFWRNANQICTKLEELKLDKSLKLRSDSPPATNRIVINYGQWETGVRGNPWLEECHAHAHIWLSSEFVLSLQSQKNNFNDPFLKRLQLILDGNVYRPNDYLYQNYTRLESRIFPKTQSSLHNTINTMQKQLANQEAMLNQILRNLGIDNNFNTGDSTNNTSNDNNNTSNDNNINTVNSTNNNSSNNNTSNSTNNTSNDNNIFTVNSTNNNSSNNTGNSTNIKINNNNNNKKKNKKKK